MREDADMEYEALVMMNEERIQREMMIAMLRQTEWTMGRRVIKTMDSGSCTESIRVVLWERERIAETNGDNRATEIQRNNQQTLMR